MRPKTGGVIFTYDFSNTPTAIFPWRCFYCVGEMMRKILLLFMLITVSANAAIMCVPDFSQMSDKCTVVSYTKNTWTVNCNGVEVSGIAIPGQNASANFAYNIEEILGYWAYCNCLMQHPVVGHYLNPLRVVSGSECLVVSFVQMFLCQDVGFLSVIRMLTWG